MDVENALTAVAIEVNRHVPDELELSKSARAAVATLCAAARREALPPERLLVRLKRALDESDNSHWRHRPERRNLLVHDVVQRTIKGYFAAEPQSE